MYRPFQMNYLLKLVLLQLIILLSVNAYTQDILEKPVTFECANLSLPKILDSIQLNSGVYFTYVDGVIPKNRYVTLNADETPLKDVLEKILRGTNVSYKVINEQIVFSDNSVPKPSNVLHTITGVIRSKSSDGLPAIQVTVIETQNAVLTDDNGFFSIEAPAGNIELNISGIGYKVFTRKMDVTGDLSLNIKLKPRNNLPLVTVIEQAHKDTLESIPPSMIRYNVRKLKRMPPVGGEADALQFIQLIPGIQSGNEGVGGIFVRGGGIDQNQMIMEGNTIYNPSHLFGFFSVFNSDAIRSIDLTKNAIPARYGERLSSVLDIKLKDPSTKKLEGSFALGSMLSKVYLEVPLIKNKTSLLIAGRKSMTEFGFLAYNGLDRKNNSKWLNYGFFDYNVKLNHTNVKKSTFFIHLFQARDWLKLYDIGSLFEEVSTPPVTRDRLNWGNISESIGWYSNPNKKFTTKLSLNYTTYQFKLNEEFLSDDPPIDDETDIHTYTSTLSDLNLKFESDLMKGADINYKLGVIASQKLFRPGAKISKLKGEPQTVIDTMFNNPRIESNEISTFVESNLKFFNRLHLYLGLRQSLFNSDDTSFIRLQPRVAVRVDISDNVRWNASFSHVTQFLHLLTNTGIGLPTDVWVPSSRAMHPQKNLQYATGFKAKLKNRAELSLEGFYKRQFNLISYDLGSKFLIDSKNWEDKVNSGEGWAYGGEFFVEKNDGRMTGWLGYTLSWSKRRFDHINNGQIFPFKFDRRHDVSIVGLWDVSNQVKLSFSWVFSSGNLTTIPTGVVTVNNPITNEDEDIYIYEEWNNYRMNPFHRLNIGLELHKEKTKYQRIVKFNLYNAYNRKNPFYVTIQKNDNNAISYRQISLFPIIPSISYECKF